MMAMWHKWLLARWVLGWALLKHILSAPYTRAQRSPERWLTTMRNEGLGATHADNWGRYERASRCVGCGLCDLFGDEALPRPSQWMMGGARLQADADVLSGVALSLRRLAPEIARVCPTQASAEDVAAVIEGHAKGLHATPGA